MFFHNPVGFLKSFPITDGVIYLSEPRSFTYEETEYPGQYKIEPGDLRIGKGLVALVRRS
jgi:hypothetical protein